MSATGNRTPISLYCLLTKLRRYECAFRETFERILNNKGNMWGLFAEVQLHPGSPEILKSDWSITDMLQRGVTISHMTGKDISKSTGMPGDQLTRLPCWSGMQHRAINYSSASAGPIFCSCSKAHKSASCDHYLKLFAHKFSYSTSAAQQLVNLSPKLW